MSDHTPAGSPLGRDTVYPDRYDPSLLYPIPRAPARAALGLEAPTLPFIGHDRWQLFELSWLDARGKPCVATATLHVPADSPHLIESKSLKLYLNSLNAARFDTADALRARIEADLSSAAGAAVTLAFGLAPLDAAGIAATSIDGQNLTIDRYGPPDADLLHADRGQVVEETLTSALLKSNCPVTGQPDWADVSIAYRGPRIDRAGLLRYIVSFREHAGFHEQCVEQIFVDVLARCAPQWLSVEARYTRRGGLDINPWRATPGRMPPPPRRSLRQ
ncbi:NADPH-dependent 7-cyano-7-deazaguanine reductase QueF [Thermomonas alba]|uniref:NADPH-dependent 7-cyano-7-deazaguanine reductase QueF n=1 Tax=Thermomonas alba TaxID=2888525 RepID=UPI001F046B0A|nr:NADPH-dependent 7-cyano-7-deazaguanine reductase QueF [Thermomonas alba]